MSEIKPNPSLEWVDRPPCPGFHSWPPSPQLANTIRVTSAVLLYASQVSRMLKYQNDISHTASSWYFKHCPRTHPIYLSGWRQSTFFLSHLKATYTRPSLNVKVYHPEDTTVKEETQINLQATCSEVKMYDMAAALLAAWYGELLSKFIVDKISL